MPYKDPEKRKEYHRQWKESHPQYDRKWVAARRQAWLANKSCAKCGSIERLELDHIDPSTKAFELKKSHGGNIWSWTQERREVELAKCQVLCRLCHIEKTRAENSRFVHGTRNNYNKHHCRCSLCRQANAVYRRQRREKGLM